MAKFKVGDRARLVAVRKCTTREVGWHVGAIVTVVESRNGINKHTGNPFEYIVQTDKHVAIRGSASVMGWQLEPITPDLGSWEEIERLTKWKPQGVTA